MIDPVEIAREVLRAWFRDPSGFKDMQKDASNKSAVEAVEKILNKLKE